MNYIKNSFKNNKKYLKQILFLLVIGFIIGFILTKKLELNEVLEQIKNIAEYLNNNKINLIGSHITIISTIFLASLTIIGLILFPLNIIYEGICISFNIFTFTKVFKFNGFIYSLIYNILIKGVYIILLMIIFKKLLAVLKIIFSKNEKIEKKTTIIKKLKQIIIYFGLILLNDIIIYLFGSKILSLLLFRIKT